MNILTIYVYKTEPKIRVRVQRDNGSIATVYIEPCHESYMQYGAEEKVLWFTLPIAEQLPKMNYFQRFRYGKHNTSKINKSLQGRVS